MTEFSKDERKWMKSPRDVRFGTLYAVKTPMDLAPWCNRVNSDNPWDQAYGTFLPYRDSETGKVYMIDTFHISRGYKCDDAYLNELPEMTLNASHGLVMDALFNCYYNDCVELNDDNASLFYEICHLPDFRVAREREYEDYDEADRQRGIRLWCEHAYPNGIFLVRKDAEKSAAKVLSALVSDGYDCFRTPSCCHPLNDRVRQAAAEHAEDEYDRLAVEKFLELNDKLEEMSCEWQAFKREIDEKYRALEEEQEQRS